MMPEDDPTWPECTGNTEEGEHDPGKHWCSEVRNWLIKGEDAQFIKPGLRYCVPVVPNRDIYAEVSVGNEVVPGFSASLAIYVEERPAGEEFIELGLWTRGEGRMAIATVLNDFCSAFWDDECKHPGHGFAEEMKLKAYFHETNVNHQVNKRVNAWYMATQQHCMACHEAFSQASAMDFDASTFGLDDSVVVRGGGSGSSAGQQRTMNQLRERFGN